MEVGPLVVLGLMWVVLNTLRKGGSRPPDRTGTPSSTKAPLPKLPGQARPGTAPPSRTPDGSPRVDPTQREGTQLERLLRELGRTLDEGRVPAQRPTVRTLPPAKSEASRRSLEAAPEGQSLEVDPARGERAVVDQDDEAERVVEQRLAAAEANLQPLSEADHQVFDQRIRQEPADRTATRAYTARQLREAIVWREILGPPVSLRGEADQER
jgi:hypothetical protein